MFNALFRLIFPHKSFGYIYKKYNIPRSIDFKFEIKNGGWFVATSPDLPGLITEAKNPQDLLVMLNDAILTYYDVPKRDADYIHNSLKLEGGGTVSLAEKNILVGA
jgi:predicted RNase H-like HicB family nuclease